MSSDTRRFNRLVKELRIGNKDQRRYAAMELGYGNDPRAIPHLENAMADPAPDVCAAAMTAYGHLAGLLAVPKLLDSMDDSKGWLNYRAAETLENVLIGCKTVNDVDVFGKMLDQGVRKLKEKLTGNVVQRLESLEEKVREKRAEFEMGGELLDARPKARPVCPACTKKRAKR